MKVDIHILGIICGDSVHTATESKVESQLDWHEAIHSL